MHSVAVHIAENHQFIVSSGDKTFQEAENWCNDRGGHLTSIHSDEENAAALAWCSNCWIGLHSTNGAHGDWEWTDGTATDYYHWGSGEPNDLEGNEDCTAMRDGEFWNDGRCDTKKRALCSIHNRMMYWLFEVYDIYTFCAGLLFYRVYCPFVSDGDEILGLRLYHGNDVMACHLKLSHIEDVVDSTYFCDINNMVTMSRCQDDGMGEIAIEIENPTAYYDLQIDSFYIDGNNMDIYAEDERFS